MAAMLTLNDTATKVGNPCRESDPADLQKRFDMLLGAFVSLLAVAEAQSRCVDDRGNVIVCPHIAKAHEALRHVTTIR